MRNKFSAGKLFKKTALSVLLCAVLIAGVFSACLGAPDAVETDLGYDIAEEYAPITDGENHYEEIDAPKISDIYEPYEPLGFYVHRDFIESDTISEEDRARVRVAAGDTHSMAVDAAGNLWVWGENTFGQLGDGNMTTYDELEFIVENHDANRPMILMENIVEIAAGTGFSLAVNENGELFSWGRGDMGQLGDGTRMNRAVPAKIMDDVVFVDAGHAFAIAITADGRLWTWGSDITRWGWDEDDIWFSFTQPAHIMDNVRYAAAGGSYILILTNDNRLYGMGSSRYLGIGDRDPNHIAETPVHILSDIKATAAGFQQSYALTFDGRLYGWGANSGDTGLVGSASDAFWIHSPEFISDRVQAVFANNMLLKDDNSLWVWGELVDTFAARMTSPDGMGVDTGGKWMGHLAEYGGTPVHIMSNMLIACSGSGRHSLAVDRNLNLFAWGGNQFGQLGTGRTNVYCAEMVPEFDGYMRAFELIENHNEPRPVQIGNLSAAG